MSLMRRLAYSAGMMIRETGQALDRLGCRFQGKYAFREQLSRHRQVMNLVDQKPIISTDVFLAPNSCVIGDVQLAPSSSVWYGAVVRADTAPVTVGSRAAIQDRAVVHASSVIADAAVISAGAVIDAATIASGAVIGPTAVVGKGASIGSCSLVKAGSVVEPGCVVGDRELWAGVPAVRERMLTDEELKDMEKLVDDVENLASAHMLETGKTHEQIEAEKLRQQLLDERSDDYNSHLGVLGREREIVEEQAQIIEEDRRLQRQAGGL